MTNIASNCERNSARRFNMTLRVVTVITLAVNNAYAASDTTSAERGTAKGNFRNVLSQPQHERMAASSPARALEMDEELGNGVVHSWVWASKASDTFADSMFYNVASHSIVFGGNNHFLKYGQSDCVVGEIHLKDLRPEDPSDTLSVAEERAKGEEDEMSSSLPRLAWSRNYHTPYNEACTVVAPGAISDDTSPSEGMYAFGFSVPQGLMTRLAVTDEQPQAVTFDQSSNTLLATPLVDPSLFGFALVASAKESYATSDKDQINDSEPIPFAQAEIDHHQASHSQQQGALFQDYKVHYPTAVDTFANGDLLVGMVVSDHDDAVASSHPLTKILMNQFPMGRDFKIVLQRLRPRKHQQTKSAPLRQGQDPVPFQGSIDLNGMPPESGPVIMSYSGGTDQYDASSSNDFQNTNTTNVTESLLTLHNSSSFELIDFNVTHDGLDSATVNVSYVPKEEIHERKDFENESGSYFEVIWTREVDSDDGTSSSSFLSDVRIVETVFNEEIIVMAGTTSGNGPHVGGSRQNQNAAASSSGGNSDYDGFVTKLDGDSGEFMNETAAAYSVRIAGARDSLHQHLKSDEVIGGICASVSKVDPYGALFVVGTTNSMLDPNFVKAGDHNIRTAFIRKLSIDTLSTMWTRQIGVVSSSSSPVTDVTGSGCAITDDGEQIFVTGVVADGGRLPHQESRGGDDVFLASFNTERGDLLYLRQAGSSHNDAAAKHNPVLADKDNYAVIVGTIKSLEDSDVFVLQFDPDGVEDTRMAVPEDNQFDEEDETEIMPAALPEDTGYYIVHTPEDQPDALKASTTDSTSTPTTKKQTRSAATNGLISITVISSLVIVAVAMFLLRDRYFLNGRDDMLREQAIHDAIDANCASPRRAHEYDIDSFFPRRVVPGEGDDQNEIMEQYDFSGSTVISGLDASIKAHEAPNLDMTGTTRSNYHELLRAYSTYNIHDDRDDMEYDDNIYSDEDDHDQLPPGMPSVV